MGDVDRQIDKTGSVFSSFHSGLKTAGVAAIGAVSVAFVGLAMEMRTATKAASDQQNAEKQLEAVLKSTGIAGAMSADELKTLSATMQSATTFADEVVLSGENMLLTFTNTLTLGDFIAPIALGNSKFFIGMAVYSYQGTAGNIPLAAAMTMGPIAIMILYLFIARRLGAFDAL